MRSTLKYGWTAWTVTSVLVVMYLVTADIHSEPTIAPLELTPGRVVELDILRLTEDGFYWELHFKTKDGKQRPELGSPHPDRRQSGFVKHANPGSDVRIHAHPASGPSIEYQARPLGGWGGDTNMRYMSSNLSIEPGVWPTVPPPVLKLDRGWNKIRLEVTKVEPPLIGETVTLAVIPPLDIKKYRSLPFFYPALLFGQAFIFVQLCWLLVLAWRSRRGFSSSWNG